MTNKKMTDEEILASLEKRLHPLGTNRDAALKLIQELRGIAKRSKNLPAVRAEMVAEATGLEGVAKAIDEMTPRYQEEYGGLRIGLRREAGKWLEAIGQLPPAAQYRPSRLDRVTFVFSCDRVIREYFPVEIPLRPGGTLTTAPPVIRCESIDLAKSVWDAENLDISSLDAWEEAVTKDGYDIFDSRKKAVPKGAKGTQKRGFNT